MAYQKMSDLLKKQEQERMDLAAGVHEAWQPIGQRERELLASFEGDYEKAPAEVQQEINDSRQTFFEEWGSDGRLVVMIDTRHATERAQLVARQEQVDQINQSLRNRTTDRER